MGMGRCEEECCAGCQLDLGADGGRASDDGGQQYFRDESI